MKGSSAGSRSRGGGSGGSARSATLSAVMSRSVPSVVTAVSSSSRPCTLSAASRVVVASHHRRSRMLAGPRWRKKRRASSVRAVSSGMVGAGAGTTSVSTASQTARSVPVAAALRSDRAPSSEGIRPRTSRWVIGSPPSTSAIAAASAKALRRSAASAGRTPSVKTATSERGTR